MRRDFKMTTLAYTKSRKTSKRTTFQDELRDAVIAREKKTSTDQYPHCDDSEEDVDGHSTTSCQSPERGTCNTTTDQYPHCDDSEEDVDGHSTTSCQSPERGTYNTATDQYPHCDDSEEDVDDLLIQLLKSRIKKTDAFKASKEKVTSNISELSDDEGGENQMENDSFLKTQKNFSPQNYASKSQDNEVADSSVINYNDLYQTMEAETSAINRTVKLSASDVTHMESTDDFVPNHSKEQEMNYSASHEEWIKWLEKKKLKSKEMKERTQKGQQKKGQEARKQDAIAFHEAWKKRKAECFRAKDIEKEERLRKEKEASLQQEEKRQLAEQVFQKWKRKRDVLQKEKYRKQLESEKKLKMKKQEEDEKRRNSCKSAFTTWCERKKNVNQEQHTSQQKTLRNKKEEKRHTNESRLEWLKKKNVELKEKMQLKQKEEMEKEEKEKEQEAKERDAVASYEAWTKRKADYFKAKAKEKQEMIRKEKEATLEKVEIRQSAEQVFLKWKSEHDDLLKEKYRKQLETENELKMKKQEQDEERKNNCKSAVSTWCETKRSVLQKQRISQKNKREEERYIKEQKDQLAIEVYESWLAKKEAEKKRQKKGRRV